MASKIFSSNRGHLRDIAGSIPDHCNKASHMISWFPSACESRVYTTSMQQQCLKKTMYIP